MVLSLMPFLTANWPFILAGVLCFVTARLTIAPTYVKSLRRQTRRPQLSPDQREYPLISFEAKVTSGFAPPSYVDSSGGEVEAFGTCSRHRSGSQSGYPRQLPGRDRSCRWLRWARKAVRCLRAKKPDLLCRSMSNCMLCTVSYVVLRKHPTLLHRGISEVSR